MAGHSDDLTAVRSAAHSDIYLAFAMVESMAALMVASSAAV
jgi:hypothetical protein